MFSNLCILHILKYLAHLFHEKCLRLSLNQCLAISVSNLCILHTHRCRCGHRKAPIRVSKFMKGFFCLCLPEPKYFVTWDINLVLNLLKTWSPADPTTLKQLFILHVLDSKKSSLDKFDLRSNGLLFKATGLTKCANHNKAIERVF